MKEASKGSDQLSFLNGVPTVRQAAPRCDSESRRLWEKKGHKVFWLAVISRFQDSPPSLRLCAAPSHLFSALLSIRPTPNLLSFLTPSNSNSLGGIRARARLCMWACALV